MFKKWTKTALILLALLLLAALFYKKVYLPKTTYVTVLPKTANMDRTVFGIGEVDAKEIYPITAQVGGRIVTLTKDQNDPVHKGELIAKIDPVDLPDQIAAAKVVLHKAELQTKAAKESLEALLAREQLARVTFTRTQKLYRQKFASRAEYDRAKADLDNLSAQIRNARAQIAAAQAEQEHAAKNIEALQQKLARFTVTSPIDGIVIARNAQQDQTVMPSQPIVTIVDPETVWVRINIDEHISGDVHEGQQAHIVLRSHPHTPLAGTVARIEAQSDPVTEERIVDVAFAKIPKPFYLKERAEATIVTGHLPHALTVPLRALVQRNGSTGVWVDRDGHAHFQPLKILASDDTKAAVEGLEKDAIILLASSDKKPLREGARVHR